MKKYYIAAIISLIILLIAVYQLGFTFGMRHVIFESEMYVHDHRLICIDVDGQLYSHWADNV